MKQPLHLKSVNQRISQHLFTLLVSVLVIAAASFAILALRPTPDGVPALVAAANLERGDRIDGRSASLVLLPREAVPENALNSFDDVQADELTRAVVKGEVLLTDDFSDSSSGIPPGRSRVVLDLERIGAVPAPGDIVQIWGPSDACVVPDSPIEKLSSSSEVEQVISGDASAFQGDPGTRVSLLVASTEVAGVLCAEAADEVHFVVAGR